MIRRVANPERVSRLLVQTLRRGHFSEDRRGTAVMAMAARAEQFTVHNPGEAPLYFGDDGGSNSLFAKRYSGWDLHGSTDSAIDTTDSLAAAPTGVSACGSKDLDDGG